MLRRLPLLAALAFCLALPLSAAAQVFGTFTWQMQPYCNRITLTLTTTVMGFTVDGADDQCGTSRGSAYGLAVFTPTGSVAVNFTIVAAPSGAAVHVSGVVDPNTGNGTWTDSAGNSGTFALGASTGGPPRPAATLATGTVTASALADGAVVAAKVDASQVQLRVSGTCPSGELIVGVNTNGSVTCAAPSTPAAALECINTTKSIVTVAANGGASNASAPACAAGYTRTGTNCESSSWNMPLVYMAIGICSAKNATAFPETISAFATCCRVPAQ